MVHLQSQDCGSRRATRSAHQAATGRDRQALSCRGKQSGQTPQEGFEESPSALPKQVWRAII